MHKVEVSLHVNIEIFEDKKVTLGNIATAIKGLGIESKIAEQIIQTIDEKEVEKLCGSKYVRKSFSEQMPMNHGIRWQKRCEVQKQLPTKHFFVVMLRKK